MENHRLCRYANKDEVPLLRKLEKSWNSGNAGPSFDGWPHSVRRYTSLHVDLVRTQWQHFQPAFLIQAMVAFQAGQTASAKLEAAYDAALRSTRLPLKQAVISAFVLSLRYPSHSIQSYSRDESLADLVNEAETDIRGALDAGAWQMGQKVELARQTIQAENCERI